MDKNSVLRTLRDNEPELQAAGIVHLRLHGSVARGQETSASDVDLIADFDSKRRFSLIDMAHLQGRLENLLGVPVDLSPAKTLKDPVRERAEREAVLAF
jgi:predicted nucleotidyltransferase